MRKRISLKTRRPDLSRDEFREHYENRHVPLGLSFIDRFQWCRYVRNHVIGTRGTPVSFDCYAEFWVSERFRDDSLEAFIQSPEFDVLNVDDRRFLDVTKRASFDVRESVLKRARSTSEVARKWALVWNHLEGERDARAIAEQIVASLADSVVESVLDTSIAPVSPGAPFDTVLSLSTSRSEPLALDPSWLPAKGYSVIEIESIETPPDQLFKESCEEAS